MCDFYEDTETKQKRKFTQVERAGRIASEVSIWSEEPNYKTDEGREPAILFIYNRVQV